jgi:hypothetical protein
MKKILLLTFALSLFACDGGDDSNSNTSCTDFNASTSPSDARQAAINYDTDDYYSLISQYGQPISEGYFTDGNELYFYAFLFETNQNGNTKVCYSVDDECVTYTYSAGCSDIDIIDNCIECVGYGDTRIN